MYLLFILPHEEGLENINHSFSIPQVSIFCWFPEVCYGLYHSRPMASHRAPLFSMGAKPSEIQHWNSAQQTKDFAEVSRWWTLLSIYCAWKVVTGVVSLIFFLVLFFSVGNSRERVSNEYNECWRLMSYVAGPVYRNCVTLFSSSTSNLVLRTQAVQNKNLHVTVQPFESIHKNRAVPWECRTLPLPSDTCQISELKKSYAFYRIGWFHIEAIKCKSCLQNVFSSCSFSEHFAFVGYLPLSLINE